MAQDGSFSLKAERLGPLPMANHVIGRLELERLLEVHVPVTDRRSKLSPAKALGVLLRSILVEREPMYRQHETVRGYASSAFGLAPGDVGLVSDDQLGRALDRLFDADRASLLTAVVVSAVRQFKVKLEELHNDSTTVRLCGQYEAASGRSIRGRRAPWITYGRSSKDHRPDLKQLLYILTTSSDGGIPVAFRCEDGNTEDSTTHLDSWEALSQIAGGTRFLYVADSKLCTDETMRAIDGKDGRFVTVLPRTRSEDKEFREWIQDNKPDWEKVWVRPHRPKKRKPSDIWYVFRYHLPSKEGWPVTWVYSTGLALAQEHSRRERIVRASQELNCLQTRLAGKRPRLKSPSQIEDKISAIVKRLGVEDYLRAWVVPEVQEIYRQVGRGRPNKETRYRREIKIRLGVRYQVDEAAIAYDQKSAGMYPLLSNDTDLKPAETLEAHKRQPVLEKRFQQLKSAHEIAPVFLKNEGRIEALFFVYFLAMLVQALIEREVRRAMERDGIKELPLYPENRLSRRPTTETIFQIFAHVERHFLESGGEVVQVFEPELTPLQAQILGLLGVPRSAYLERAVPMTTDSGGQG